MKKLILTAAIILGFAMGSYAQKLFLYGKETQDGLFWHDNFYIYWMMSDDEIENDKIENDNEPQGGLFGRGDIGLFGMTRDGGTFSLCLPGHNFNTNWNGGSQGHDDELVPLGSAPPIAHGLWRSLRLIEKKKEGLIHWSYNCLKGCV